MSDPITASIELGLLAIKTGAAVAQWWNTRESSTARGSSPDGVGSGGFYRQKPSDLLYVMATLGQWLFYLDVVEVSALPTARSATRLAFAAGDPEDDDLGDMFDGMDEFVQNAVACGMFFCADCWPMHMWKGFGCGVFNELRWADPTHSNIHCLELDNSITALKSQPHPWQPLKKSPSAISKIDPIFEAADQSSARKRASLQKDIIQTLEKHGFPQPIAPYNHIRISHWWIPFATWNGSSMYENEYHKTDAISKYQYDPGRFLWAWTAGKKARLAPGEAIVLLEDHIGALAQWLEGLRGINFRVLLDNQVNYGNIKFGRNTRAMFKKLYGNEYGIYGQPLVIVHDPNLEGVKPAMEQLAATIRDLQISPPTSQLPPLSPTDSQMSSSTVQTPMSGTISFPTSPGTRRRPVPRPPPTVARRVIATHDFVPESDEELAFSQGDVIDILNDDSDDGWWKARLRGKIGLIPNTYVEDAVAQETKEVEEPTVALSATDTSVVTNHTASDIPSAQNQQGSYFAKRDSLIRKPIATSNNSAGQVPQVSSQNLACTNSPREESSTTPSAEHLEHQRQQQYMSPPPAYSMATTENLPLRHDQQSSIGLTPPSEQQSVAPLVARAEKALWNPENDSIAQPSILYTLHGHSKVVKAVAFSSTNDVLASGSDDKTIRLWDPVTGRNQHTISAHDGFVEDIAFAPNSAVLASASSDKTVKLWDARTATAIQTLDQSNWAQSVSISADGKMLAAGLFNDTIKLWDGRSSSLLYTLKGHKSIVQSVEFSPDSRTLASGSNDKSVMTWETSSGRLLHKIKAHPGMMKYVMAVTFSPDGQFIASAALDGNVKVWNTSTGAPKLTLACGTCAQSVKFSPDGNYIVASTIGGVVIVWNRNGRELLRLKAHEKSVKCISLSGDGTLMATSSEDMSVKLWKST